MDEIACKSAKGGMVLRAESLSFSDIPGQSQLFTIYQTDPLSLTKYYPSIVESHTQIAARIPEVLANHTADRGILCDALEEMNRKFDSCEKTFENIALLRDPETVAVVTGQQAGLFTGPLYTIYKALSAIKMTECLRDRGFKVVPVFWAATEDHDFEEVSHAFVLDKTGELAELRNKPQLDYENQPVGYVQLDETIQTTVEQLFADLPQSEFTAELRSFIENSWAPGAYFGDAFARLMTKLFGRYGLIILCPLDARLKHLAAPIYAKAIEHSAEIVDALKKRSGELVADGYHAQVQIADDYFPLFWQGDDHKRNALRKTSQNKFHTRDNSREFTLDELTEIAKTEPTRFSPSVVLRSVIQDHLLPTVCYFGGAAEIAYFAQSGEVYRILDRPRTPILHRQSFTIIEPKHERTLNKYDLKLSGLFDGSEKILAEIVEEFLNKDSARIFTEVEEEINTELDRLDHELSKLDVTLVENLVKRRRKINYHIGALRHKFHLAQMRKNETVRRQITALFAALLPHGSLQERTLNVTYFMDRYGD
ncbi:MAG: bacillithiol biosynthesis cysteine-adding enzyme BshC, partial [Acidobacteriota bacterium]